MVNTYINYWKKSFDYKSKANLTELFQALAGNFVVILIFILLGFIVPVTWENLIINAMYIVEFLMIIPTIALIVRLVKNASDKKAK